MRFYDHYNTSLNDDIDLEHESSYNAWLQYAWIGDLEYKKQIERYTNELVTLEQSSIIHSATTELNQALFSMLNSQPRVSMSLSSTTGLVLATTKQERQLPSTIRLEDIEDEGYAIKTHDNQTIYIVGRSDKGILYGTFHLLRLIQMKKDLDNLDILENPANQFRMINQWDNVDSSVERGYSGNSIFYRDNQFSSNLTRIKDYARLLSSTGVNAISINNVNVHQIETNFITSEFLPDVKKVASIFRAYGITTFLAINYASPIGIGNMETADPLNPSVQQWWKEAVKEIYESIPDFGGFIVKADSENRPGPFTYNRNHADGANLLAKALEPYNGVVIWRCFVYNCKQDWRDRETDRARAAYDHFTPLDGKFNDNVILQIKNGPMDFQVREPVSPLIGALKDTNQILEFQIAQEYTGQQRHLCYLIPQWKEVLDFDTYAKGKGTEVKTIVNGSLYNNKYSGISAVSNIGNDYNWTGHTLAQANLYGFGRLIWNPDLSADEITDEWVRMTFGNESQTVEVVSHMLSQSWEIYENYTSPLGVGWMINPGHHYGPNIEGYEYSAWGTYHFSDRDGTGVNRTLKNGTGYTGQYFSPNKEIYESIERCPDELLLFFHHVPYSHQLKSGETVIQHIYNTHFEGVEQVERLAADWRELEGKVDKVRFNDVLSKLEEQLEHSKEWRDIINTYYYRKSGIDDRFKRKIY
ncbi:alpha-glucuronidase family glycosyl hydrolase [Alteribacter populi]|uniref:alpha-glucuronidase family glycosyl hydrolase n=1 Tax=Alteribacter populi TaxID=2011011 RepID=UPI000BBB2BA1|nr:alpha-glucuronidase family glycosyl hydrolase [Alteribacter populi]